MANEPGTEPKSGFFTSEFILSIATMVLASLLFWQKAIDQETWMSIIIGSGGTYSLSRGLSKLGNK